MLRRVHRRSRSLGLVSLTLVLVESPAAAAPVISSLPFTDSAGNLMDHAPHPLVLASTPCIGSSGVSLVDEVADLPGPGGISMPGTVQVE